MGNMKRSVLVTGCSEGGMGWDVAKQFAARGWRTFATLRNVSKAGSLAQQPGVEILPLDVTSPESIATCVNDVSALTGGKLDCLYNNSGVDLIAPIADTNLDDARHLFEVNVWGVLATTQAFLPLLMAAKGTVANAASVRTQLMQPYDGIYAASKCAVEMLSEQMRLEFAPFGVKVLGVNVGAVDTLIFDNNPTNNRSTLPPNSLYKPIESTIAKFSTGDFRPAGLMKPEDFAKRVVGDLHAGKTGQVDRGSYATMIRYLTKILPQFILDRIATNSSGLKELAKIYEESTGKKQA